MDARKNADQIEQPHPLSDEAIRKLRGLTRECHYFHELPNALIPSGFMTRYTYELATIYFDQIEAFRAYFSKWIQDCIELPENDQLLIERKNSNFFTALKRNAIGEISARKSELLKLLSNYSSIELPSPKAEKEWYVENVKFISGQMIGFILKNYLLLFCKFVEDKLVVLFNHYNPSELQEFSHLFKSKELDDFPNDIFEKPYVELLSRDDIDRRELFSSIYQKILSSPFDSNISLFKDNPIYYQYCLLALYQYFEAEKPSLEQLDALLVQKDLIKIQTMLEHILTLKIDRLEKYLPDIFNKPYLKGKYPEIDKLLPTYDFQKALNHIKSKLQKNSLNLSGQSLWAEKKPVKLPDAYVSSFTQLKFK